MVHGAGTGYYKVIMVHLVGSTDKVPESESSVPARAG